MKKVLKAVSHLNRVVTSRQFAECDLSDKKKQRLLQAAKVLSLEFLRILDLNIDAVIEEIEFISENDPDADQLDLR